MLKFKSKVLLFLCGLLWAIAAFNIIRIGVAAFREGSFSIPLVILLGVLIFVAFHFMFTSILKKNVKRLEAAGEEKLFVLNMMPLRSWLIMIFMITLGISLRTFGIASDFFIAFFYNGLGLALGESGLRYLLVALKPRA